MGKYIECGKVKEDKPVTRKLTKREQAVMALMPKLPELTDAQRRWILTEPFKEDMAFFWKRGKVWCQNCGNVEFHADLGPQLAIDLDLRKYVCPCCGKELKLVPYEYHLKGFHEDYRDTTIVTCINGYTVFRTFRACRTNILYYTTMKSVHEVYQNWICPDGREVIMSKRRWYSMYSGIKYAFASKMQPRKRRSGIYYADAYDVQRNWFYPIWRVAPLVRRNGWCGKLFKGDASPITKVQNIIVNPVAEMLAKNGHFNLFDYWSRRGCNDMEKYVPSIRICNRNGYTIKDGSMWCDYIDLLLYFQKDVHNAYYVCPKDLKAEHDRLMKKKECIETAKELEAKRKEAKRHEKAYKKLHGRFFGVCFGNKDIKVNVVSSVQEMAEEGVMMHHCVYWNGYYKRPESLILSAKDSEGNRLETVEVSLRTWSILQSRGKYNHPTDRHDEIIKLVNKNMNKLKKIAV